MSAFDKRRAEMLVARLNKEPNIQATAQPCQDYWRVDYELRYADGHVMSASEGSYWPAFTWATIQSMRKAATP
jgi:hypothetical protein